MVFGVIGKFIDEVSTPVDTVVGEVGKAIGVSVPSGIIRSTIKSGGIFPPDIVIPPFPIPLPSFPIPPNPVDFIKELVEAIAKLFNDVLTPFVNKLDATLSSNITKLIDGGTGLVEKFGDVAKDIINRAGATYNEILEKTISQVQTLLDQVLQNVRSILKETNNYIEERIDQVAAIVASSLDKITKIAENYTPGRIMDDLVSPALDKISKLEEQLFEDINQVLDKIINEVDEKGEELKKQIQLGLLSFPNFLDECRNELGLQKPGLLFSDIEYYKLIKCYSLKRLEKDNHITLNERLEIYAQLQRNAAIARFLAADISSPGIDDLYARDWLEYGVLYKETEKFLGAETNASSQRE
jgi:ElaB/YqjD/DUF883 family membrane-anchored ribosome-binding protein